MGYAWAESDRPTRSQGFIGRQAGRQVDRKRAARATLARAVSQGISAGRLGHPGDPLSGGGLVWGKPVQADRTAAWLNEVSDQAQQGRFTAAAGANDRHKLPAGKVTLNLSSAGRGGRPGKWVSDRDRTCTFIRLLALDKHQIEGQIRPEIARSGSGSGCGQSSISPKKWIWLNPAWRNMRRQVSGVKVDTCVRSKMLPNTGVQAADQAELCWNGAKQQPAGVQRLVEFMRRLSAVDEGVRGY